MNETLNREKEEGNLSADTPGEAAPDAVAQKIVAQDLAEEDAERFSLCMHK